MKILKVDKDKIKTELTKEEINKLIDTYVANGETLVLQYEDFESR